MTSVTVNFDNYEAARKFAEGLRLRTHDGVVGVAIGKEDIMDALPFERISGVPHTLEQLREAVKRSEEDILAGRTYTMDEVRARFPRV